MKFILYITLCSISTNDCLEPVKNEKIFNDWNSCIVGGLNVSNNALTLFDKETINSLKLRTKFSCVEETAI